MMSRGLNIPSVTPDPHWTHMDDCPQGFKDEFLKWMERSSHGLTQKLQIPSVLAAHKIRKIPEFSQKMQLIFVNIKY